MQLLAGFFLALSVCYLAYLTHSLSRDGALAAAVLGTTIFGLGGWQWAVVLLTFFITSSLLDHSTKNLRAITAEKYAKGGRRDAGQVIGNGGVALFFVVLHAALPHAAWPWLGFAAAVAAVNADTWATELGVLARTPPRLITHLDRLVQQGTSGGVSIAGTAAAALGSTVIGIFAALFAPQRSGLLFWCVFAGGVLGALFDSLLGATVQAMYRCPRDSMETEQHPLHRCGATTIHTRGWRWLNNDWVNLACGLFGALTAFALQFTLGAG